MTSALARWYRENGRHTLPWRATRDRWTVLVSEVMLHQTQVPRVAAVFDAFMDRVPDPRGDGDGRSGRGHHRVGTARLPAPGAVALGGIRPYHRRTAGPPI